jgi:hypothetical protein
MPAQNRLRRPNAYVVVPLYQVRPIQVWCIQWRLLKPARTFALHNKMMQLDKINCYVTIGREFQGTAASKPSQITVRRRSSKKMLFYWSTI